MAETFSAGEVCFAKVKGYPPWPAIVREVMPGMVYIPILPSKELDILVNGIRNLMFDETLS